MERSRATVPAPKWLCRAEWGLALALTAVALLLHVRVITHAGALWRDETNTVVVAHRPTVAAMAAALEHESFPLLPFATVRAWSAIGMGASDFRLRLLGFLVGLGILGAVWWNRKLTRGAVPIFALALGALNPVVLRWGDSLRGYGAGALLIVLVFGLVYRMAASPSRWTFAWAAVAAVLAVQCVYQNVLLLAAACIGAVVVAIARRRRQVIWLSLAVGIVAAASLLPYAGVIARAREHFVVITLSADFGRIWRALLEALGGGAHRGILGWLAPAVWLVVYGLSVVSLIRVFRSPGSHGDFNENRQLARYGSTVAVVAPALFFLFVYRLKFLTEPWYFIVLLGILAVSLDAALSTCAAWTGIRIAKLAAGASAAIIAVASAYPASGTRQTNVDVIARTLREQAAREDLIVLNPWYCGVSFGRYFHGETPWSMVPPLADREIHRFDLVREMMTESEPLAPLLGRMAGTLRSGHRVWIVGALSAPPPGQGPEHLPPASDETGWYSGPYLGAWSQEVGYFLRSHAVRGQRVEVHVHGPVSHYENLLLFVTEGWTESK